MHLVNNQGLENHNQVDSAYHRLNKLFESDDMLRRQG